MCIYLPIVNSHWNGNGHGTFAPDLCCARRAHSSLRRVFQSTYQVGTSSLFGACHADVQEE